MGIVNLSDYSSSQYLRIIKAGTGALNYVSGIQTIETIPHDLTFSPLALVYSTHSDSNNTFFQPYPQIGIGFEGASAGLIVDVNDYYVNNTDLVIRTTVSDVATVSPFTDIIKYYLLRTSGDTSG